MTGRNRDPRRMLVQISEVNTKTAVTMEWFYSRTCLERKESMVKGVVEGAERVSRNDKG